ncbi:metallophosphoesterase family protein [Leuconostoc gelidum subsp. aenigmaticum]|uniref:metallophosphoesterase family protein n=1 Tax=Leuconostoc gelidum TaxID=1244 RepID=UPI001CC4B89A|nr:metallophosphoesterase family protein [Leuconostoc gelidum]MBZ6002832.1 metallophosphoesterase family protein [Leuconostoc gelidum subsp. aenigmaticum]
MKQKIALLSDVHGNSTALSAVVEDLKKRDVDTCWFLGDLVMPGPGNNELFDLLADINTEIYIKGNWDDCFLEVIKSHSTLDLSDESDVYIGILGQYVYENLSTKNRDKLKKFETSTTRVVNNVTISISHNLPDKNYGSTLIPVAETSNFDALFADSSYDIAVYGHIHHQLLRYSSQGQLVINPGTIGEPFFAHAKLNNDRRAQYAILEIDETGLADVDFRKVAYNLDQEVSLANHVRFPYTELYSEMIYDGRVYTHNQEILRKINQKNNYLNTLRAFLDSFSEE